MLGWGKLKTQHSKLKTDVGGWSPFPLLSFSRNGSCIGNRGMMMVNRRRVFYHDEQAGGLSYRGRLERRPTGTWVEGYDRDCSDAPAKGGDRE